MIAPKALPLCVQLSIVGSANGSGGRFLGCENAVSILRNSKYLKQCKIKHKWEAIIKEYPTGHGLSALRGIRDMNTRLASQVSKIIKRGDDLLVLGGDHSCAIGTWSGVAAALRQKGDIGLVWVDAHLDSHQPETSETGNIHGMPVSHLLGYGASELKEIADNKAKIHPQNLAFIGVRSYEPPEIELLEKIGVRIFFMEQVQKRGIHDVLKEAIEIVSKKTIGFGLSIDIDGFSPCDAPAVGTPVSGGINAKNFMDAIKKQDLSLLLATEIVEFLPGFDDEYQKSERLVIDLIETIYTRKIQSVRLK